MENITLWEAFKHAMSFGSYWLCLLASVGVAAAVYFFYIKKAVYEKGWEDTYKWILGFLLALILAAVFVSPCTIKANTTKDMAKRGVYIR